MTGVNAASSVASVVAEIERLGALRAAGQLSLVEFAKLKAAVLQRMETG